MRRTPRKDACSLRTSRVAIDNVRRSGTSVRRAGIKAVQLLEVGDPVLPVENGHVPGRMPGGRLDHDDVPLLRNAVDRLEPRRGQDGAVVLRIVRMPQHDAAGVDRLPDISRAIARAVAPRVVVGMGDGCILVPGHRAFPTTQTLEERASKYIRYEKKDSSRATLELSTTPFFLFVSPSTFIYQRIPDFSYGHNRNFSIARHLVKNTRNISTNNFIRSPNITYTVNNFINIRPICTTIIMVYG